MPPALTIHYGSATSTPNPARATTIGRAPDCDLVIHNPYVSHHHARVTFTDDGWLLEDMGSANGLSINGIHTTSVLLLNSTKVTLAQGATIVCIVGTNGPATPAQPPRGTLQQTWPSLHYHRRHRHNRHNPRNSRRNRHAQ